jgi:tetratricopeptide (TPR) repeat protein
MRANVFTDRTLARHAGRFVWLEVDTEKAQNADFRKRFPAKALPSFFVIDAASERIVARWTGGATVKQLDKILEDARVAAGAAKSAPPKDAAAAAEAAFARAEAFYADGKNAEAGAAYREAIAAAPKDWPRYARAVESALYALSDAGEHETAVGLAREAFPRLARTASAANVAGSGLDAALSLPAEHPQRAELVGLFEASAQTVVSDLKIPVAADDRSGVFGVLVDAREDAKDEAGVLAVALRWAAFLEFEAARARTPEARTVYDSHRLSAYLKLNEPERAIPMLEASERDLPDDYNPPARLALAYKAMKKWDEALAASTRALGKVYGPRKITVLNARADIHTGRGDTAAARQTLQDALLFAQSLPDGQRSETMIKSLEKKLAALSPQ